MLAFLPICASKGVILVVPRRVILKVLIISATLDAILNGVLFESIFMTPSRRFNVCINRSTTPMDLWSSTGANKNYMVFNLQNI